MSEQNEIKIRALPRSAPKPTKGQENSQGKKSQRWIIYVGTSCIAAFAVVFLFPMPKFQGPVARQAPKAKVKQATGQTELASVTIKDSVSRHMQEAQIHRDIMKRRQELENGPFRNAKSEPNMDDLNALPARETNLGIQMESEGSAEQVYEDVHGYRDASAEALPVDKINARLANRKWMNEMERAERINYISQFIRNAYDKGYEVEIDQNLVVVGVKKISRNQTLNINQVIDRLAKQGQ